MTGALWISDFFCFLTLRPATRHWPPSMIQCIDLNFAAAAKRSRHWQSNIQISFQTRPGSITVINTILDCYQKEERSDIYSKVTSKVTFKMMLEHSKIDMRLKGLVVKLQAFEMPSFSLKFLHGSEVNRHRGICRWMCLLLDHLIKQMSFSVSSNMNWASHLVDYIYQLIFDSTLKDIC